MIQHKRFSQLIVFILVAAIWIPAGGREAIADTAAAVPVPVSVSGGYAHSLAAWSDGTVTGWGYNKYGQVGDGTAIDQYVPRRIAGLSDIVQVAAGNNSSFALDASGEVWAWGQTYSSYLGYDAITSIEKRSGPVKLEGIHNAVSIVADGYAGIAVLQDGTATLWYPSYEQNANMQLTVRYLKLPGVTGIRCAVIAGSDALFLMDGGTVKQLSIYNSVYGRIRWATDPVTVNTLVPPSIKQIAATGEDAFLLRTDGQVLRWNRSLKASSAVPGLNNVYKIQTGSTRLFAVQTNGTLWQWNYNAGTLVKPFQIREAKSITGVWPSMGSFGIAQQKDGRLVGWGDGY